MTSSPTKRCVILGGGGHARVLIDIIVKVGLAEPSVVLDANPNTWHQTLQEVPIIGDDSLLPKVVEQGIGLFVVGLGSVGDASNRIRLFELGIKNNLRPLSVIHPSVIFSRWADIKRGCQLLPNAIVNAGSSIGENVIINSGSIVEHDCIIDNHAHIATGAVLASSVTVGAGAHIGAGATIIQGITIGSGAIVGAGAVVVKDVAPVTTVVGVPARILSQRNAD